MRSVTVSETCKVMIRLALDEPGDNWVNAEYRWSKYDPAVPGWMLPSTWTVPDEENDGEGQSVSQLVRCR